VERARTALLNDFEKTQLDTGAYVRALSEFAAIGDWRLFFLYRERLKKVALADVQRVAEHYLKPANRVLGTFIPTDAPERADIPAFAGMAGRARRVQGRVAGRAPGRSLRSLAEEHRVARRAQRTCPTASRPRCCRRPRAAAGSSRR
jgi:zinc protease